MRDLTCLIPSVALRAGCLIIKVGHYDKEKPRREKESKLHMEK